MWTGQSASKWRKFIFRNVISPANIYQFWINECVFQIRLINEFRLIERFVFFFSSDYPVKVHKRCTAMYGFLMFKLINFDAYIALIECLHTIDLFKDIEALSNAIDIRLD